MLLAGLVCGLGLLPARAQSLGTQQALDNLRQQYHLPALLAAVIEPGMIYYVGSGRKRSDQPEVVGLDDYFHLGSETKGITSLLAGKLVEQGKIQWETKLTEAVPELKATMRPDYADVTLDKLLSHRAGIQPYMKSVDHQALPPLTGTVSDKRLQFARFVLQQPPAAHDPGKHYAYSNAGYVLAALMLERVSGKSWEDLVAATFEQLQLHYMLGFPNRTDARQPWGHRLKVPGDSVFVPQSPTSRYQGHDYMAPAMELSMTLPDFAHLVQLHLKGLLGRNNYLTSETYQTLHFGKPEYAYGWGVGGSASRGGLVSSHDGTTQTFFCHTIIYPGQQLALVVMTNAGGGESVRQACHELAQQLCKRYLAGLL